jgi:hypothetical protein
VKDINCRVRNSAFTAGRESYGSCKQRGSEGVRTYQSAGKTFSIRKPLTRFSFHVENLGKRERDMHEV